MEQGLTCIHDETSGDSQALIDSVAVQNIDIIAVHGLGAHRDYAWRYKKNPEKGVARDINWLKDLLPETLRSSTPSIHSRIFCFNYESRWLGGGVSSQRITTIANQLLDAVDVARSQLSSRENETRPIIFIGHSYGGLVIEKAIVRLNTRGHSFQQLLNIVAGVILLGTPHRGSSAQPLGKVIARSAQIIQWGEVGLLLDVAEDSMETLDMVNDFATIMHQRHFADTRAVVTFFENKKSNYGRRIGNLFTWEELVVTESSATIPAIYALSLDSDHFQLNKFANKEDGNYKRVSETIHRIAVAAPTLIASQRQGKQEVRTYFEVPNRRVLGFVGREDVLSKMEEILEDEAQAGPRVFVIRGIGGQGKSQVALEYCRSKKSAPYTGIFWIDASNEISLRAGFEIIADRVKDIDQTFTDVEMRVQYVLRTFEAWHLKWLFIFDNYDDPRSFPNIQDYIPQGQNGAIIVTSRHAGASDLAQQSDTDEWVLHGLDEVAALTMLFQQTKLERSESNEIVATTIVSRLGYHPLAITQASAYIKSQKAGLHHFIDHYTRRRKKILESTPPLSQYRRKLPGHEQETTLSVFTTWELSFQQLQEQTGASGVEVKLLTLLAFFDHKDISEEIFTGYLAEDVYGGKEELLGWMDGFTESERWDSDLFKDAIAILAELSLIQSFTDGTDGFSHLTLHPLIQDWIRVRVGLSTGQENAAMALLLLGQLVSAILPTGYHLQTTSTKQAVLSHILVGEENYGNFLSRFPHLDVQEDTNHQLADRLDWCQDFLSKEGQYRLAGVLQRHVLSYRIQTLGEDHPSTLTSVSNLATVLRYQGKYEASEAMNRRALEGKEQVLGVDHPETLTSVNNLALVLRYQGKYEAAEAMNRRALDGYEKVLGVDHPETLISVDNLASVLRYQGKYEAAEAMNRRALEGKEKVLGVDHPETLTSVNNLALVLQYQGKYEAAEAMNRRALDGYEKVLGVDHPETLISVDNLALVLRYQGKYEAAEAMNRRALDGYEKVLGVDHPETLTSVSNLASVLRYQGKYEAAEAMNRRALDGYEKVLGVDHPETLISVDNLASVLRYQGKYEAAEEMNRRALEGKEKVLGVDHPETLTSVSNLATVLQDQGKYEAVEDMNRRALDGYEKVLGVDHPETLTSVNNLALVLQYQGKYEAAEAMNRRALDGYEKVLGVDHPSTLTSVSNLASVLRYQGKYEASEAMNRRALEGKEKLLGVDHPETLISVSIGIVRR